MKFKTVFILFLAAVSMPKADAQPAAVSGKKVVAYVTSWSSVAVDPTVMTHINYAFGGVDSQYKVFVEGQGRFSQIVALKAKNPQLKVLLSVGGWGRGKFTPMSSTDAGRKTFARSCRDFCDRYGIDGIDIDWEFPGNNSSGETSPQDEKQNYTLLMRDLRQALGDGLLLTMASSSSPGYYDYRSCIEYLDFVNVMTYDMASAPNHHSALYRGGTVGNAWKVAHESIQEHLNAGIPADKLVMGLAFYGNGNGDGSGSANQVSLQEIENGIASGKWTDHWDDTAKVPYVTNSKTGAFVFGYDNARSLTIKCQYIIDNDLAGGMYWEYANDDNAGTERTTVYDCLIGHATRKANLRLGDVELSYAGANTYTATTSLVKGADYAATGTDELTADNWYCDPDFFVRNADGTYRFQALSGSYRVSACFNEGCFRVTPVDEAGNALTYSAADGTGCLWMIGNDGVGKPSYAYAGNWGTSNNWSPTPAMFCAVPQVRPGIFQLTLTVGRQLRADDVNFKFFHQPGYGNDSSDEFNTTGSTRISTASELFRIDTAEDGNVKLRSGQHLTDGTTYVFTLDCTDPAHAVLSVADAATAVQRIVGGDRASAVATAVYDLHGRRRAQQHAPAGLYIQNGAKVVVPRR